MEIIPDDKESEIVTAPVMKKTKMQTKKTAKSAKRGRKSAKNKLAITDKADDDSKTMSPLPGLEIEIQRINEPDESIVKLAKSPSKQLVIVLERLDIHSFKTMSNVEKSVSTLKKCPITAHGSNDESPPQINEIDRTILPRDLSAEFDADIIDIFDKHKNDVNVSSNKNSKASVLPKKSNSSPDTPDTTPNESTDVKIQKSASVCIRRLSQIEIDPYYVLHSRNLVFDSSSTSLNSERSTPTSNKEPTTDKTTRVRKSINPPIVFEEILNKKSASPREDRTGANTREPDKSQCRPNQYYLRKTQNSLKILEDSKNEESAAKKRKLEKENTTAKGDPLSSGSSMVDRLQRSKSARVTQSCKEEGLRKRALLEKLDTTLVENAQHHRSLLRKVMEQLRSQLQKKAGERRRLVLNLQETIEQEENLVEEFQTQIQDIFHDWSRKQSDMLSSLLRKNIRENE